MLTKGKKGITFCFVYKTILGSFFTDANPSRPMNIFPEKKKARIRRASPNWGPHSRPIRNERPTEPFAVDFPPEYPVLQRLQEGWRLRLFGFFNFPTACTLFQIPFWRAIRHSFKQQQQHDPPGRKTFAVNKWFLHSIVRWHQRHLIVGGLNLPETIRMLYASSVIRRMLEIKSQTKDVRIFQPNLLFQKMYQPQFRKFFAASYRNFRTKTWHVTRLACDYNGTWRRQWETLTRHFIIHAFVYISP